MAVPLSYLYPVVHMISPKLMCLLEIVYYHLKAKEMGKLAPQGQAHKSVVLLVTLDTTERRELHYLVEHKHKHIIKKNMGKVFRFPYNFPLFRCQLKPHHAST